MQSLKPASHCVSVLSTKPGTVNAVAFDTSLWVCTKPAVDHLAVVFQTSHFSR